MKVTNFIITKGNVTDRDSVLRPRCWGNARDERQEQALLMLLEWVDRVLCTENTCARAGVRMQWSCSTVNSCVRRESVVLNFFRKCTAQSRTVGDFATTSWRVFRLRIEEKTWRYGKPTRSGRQLWELGGMPLTQHLKTKDLADCRQHNNEPFHIPRKGRSFLSS